MSRQYAALLLGIVATAALAQGTGVPFPGNDHSYGVAGSRDLRYVAFVSNASNLVPGDTNGQPDVFVYDRNNGTLVRASVDANGLQANAQSAWPSLSANGSFVVFDTGATSLTGQPGLVRKDLRNGAVTQIAVRSSYQPSYPSLSDDGARVAYTFGSLVRFHDTATGTTTNVTSGAQSVDSFATISGNGRYVFFASSRDTLVPGDTNAAVDVFRWDSTNGTIERVSLGEGGVQGNADAVPSGIAGVTAAPRMSRPFAVSANGTQISFVSNATNLMAGDARGGLFGRNISNGFMIRFAACAPTCLGDTFDALDLSSTATHMSFHVQDNAFDGAAALASGYYVTATVPVALARVGGNGTSRIVFDSRYGSAIGENGAAYAIQSIERLPGVDDRARYGDVFARVAGAPDYTILSRGAVGQPGDGHSRQPALSDDGRRVAFASDSTLLAANDTNAYRDVFVRDLSTGATTLVSSAPGGAPSDGPSDQPSISGDGSVVAFASSASNLVAGDTTNLDIFARVVSTGAIERISTGVTQIQGQSALSLDGRYVAFAARNTLYLRDRQTGTLIVASPTVNALPPDQDCNFCESFPLSISDDGRFVAYNARSNNHAVGQSDDDTDVLVFDRIGNTVELNSRASGATGAEFLNGSYAPTISGDGRYVAWYSAGDASLVPGAPAATTIFVRDRTLATTRPVGISPRPSNFIGTEPRPTMSRDGSSVAFLSSSASVVPGDSNTLPDLFLWNRATGLTRRISLTAAWSQSDGSSYVFDLNLAGHPKFFAIGLARDANHVAYASAATNLGVDDRNAADDVFVTRLDSQAIARASAVQPPPGDVDRSAPVASGNGRVAVMVSTDRSGALGGPPLGGPGAKDAKGIGSKWAGILAYDFTTSEETQVDVSSTGVAANDDSFFPALAPSGDVATFASDATNLGSALDGNGRSDVFVRDLSVDITVALTAGGDGDSGRSATTSIGDKWNSVFESNATNLPGAASANTSQDIFLAREGLVENTFTIEPVSVAIGGGLANGPSSDPAISGSGRYAAFASLATNLVASDPNGLSDIFIRDMTGGTTVQVSLGPGGVAPNGASGQPAVANVPGPGDKWAAAYESEASNIVGGDVNAETDVFVRDSDGVIELVSVGLGGLPANGRSLNPAISPDSRWVAFVSTADNLVPGDTNNAPDVFLYDRTLDTTTRVSAAAGVEANDFSLQPSIGLDGGGNPVVVWDTAADNLQSGDTDEAIDVYQYEAADDSLASTNLILFKNGFE